MPNAIEPDVIEICVERSEEIAADYADLNVSVRGSSFLTGEAGGETVDAAGC